MPCYISPYVVYNVYGLDRLKSTHMFILAASTKLAYLGSLLSYQEFLSLISRRLIFPSCVSLLYGQSILLSNWLSNCLERLSDSLSSSTTFKHFGCLDCVSNHQNSLSGCLDIWVFGSIVLM